MWKWGALRIPRNEFKDLLTFQSDIKNTKPWQIHKLKDNLSIEQRNHKNRELRLFGAFVEFVFAEQHDKKDIKFVKVKGTESN